MTRHYESYSYETKLEAMRLYFEEGLSQREIVEKLGIYDRKRLRTWSAIYRKQGAEGFIYRKGRKRKHEDRDAYVRKLEMENELLKKFHALLRRWCQER